MERAPSALKYLVLEMKSPGSTDQRAFIESKHSPTCSTSSGVIACMFPLEKVLALLCRGSVCLGRVTSLAEVLGGLAFIHHVSVKAFKALYKYAGF